MISTSLIIKMLRRILRILVFSLITFNPSHTLHIYTHLNFQLLKFLHNSNLFNFVINKTLLKQSIFVISSKIYFVTLLLTASRMFLKDFIVNRWLDCKNLHRLQPWLRGLGFRVKTPRREGEIKEEVM